METKEEAVRSEKFRRCAKAAILLFSLKSSSNRSFNTSSNHRNQEKDLVEKEIGVLKMKLAMERIKIKRIKLCSLMEVILQVMIVLSFITLLLVLALHF